MIRVGILGASGYMGGEALRVLLEHPAVKVEWVTSRSSKKVEYYHRNLYGSGVDFIRLEEITPCDAVFVALPSGKAMEITPGLLKNGTKVIDLGADFRLSNLDEWREVYGKDHSCKEIAGEAVYGIAELHREAIGKARVIGNPGCYSSAAILGLAPLVKARLIDLSTIVVNGMSGTAGAGAELAIPCHHPEIGNNLIPYNVVDHRHTYEMEQELGLLTTGKVVVHFTPTYVPITRGILAVCHCFPEKTVDRIELLDLYREFYKDEFFVRIFDIPKDPNATWQYLPYPWVAAVSGTNFCHIGVDFDAKRNRIVVFSVLDSVGKGGAHAGVQNLNIIFGLEETMGLTRYGLHPY